MRAAALLFFASGSVHDFAPDTLAWEPIASSYSEWAQVRS
jgi:hypothetical protein